MRTRPVRPVSFPSPFTFGSPKNSGTTTCSSASSASPSLVTPIARGFCGLSIVPVTVMAAVSIRETRPSASSATNRCAPVGVRARPVGSEPTSIGSLTVGEAVSMPLTLTTVAAARLATQAVLPSALSTTAEGSSPVVTLLSRVSSAVRKIEIESSSGLTMTTSASSSVIAMVPDFDGRASTRAHVQARVQLSWASQPAAPSRASPLPASTAPSPHAEVAARKSTGGVFGALSLPSIMEQLPVMSALNRTLPRTPAHPPLRNTTSLRVPFLVACSFALRAAHSVPTAIVRFSSTTTSPPGPSSGAPCTAKRPAVQSAGFGAAAAGRGPEARSDAAVASSRSFERVDMPCLRGAGPARNDVTGSRSITRGSPSSGARCRRDLPAPHRRQQRLGRRVVAERLAHVREAIDVPWAEDEAAAELERMLPEAMLAVSGLPGPGTGDGVVAAEEVEERGAPQAGGAVGQALLVHQQREGDPGLLAEGARVGAVPEPHRGEPRPGRAKLVLVRAQLRDVLAAEDSAVVAQEDEHPRPGLPERAEPHRVPVSVGKRRLREGGGQRGAHDGTFSSDPRPPGQCCVTRRRG